VTQATVCNLGLKFVILSQQRILVQRQRSEALHQNPTCMPNIGTIGDSALKRVLAEIDLHSE
jgi:hypothetical protein